MGPKNTLFVLRIYRDHICQKEQKLREPPQPCPNQLSQNKRQRNHPPLNSIKYILVAKHHLVPKVIGMVMESHVLQPVINIQILYFQSPGHPCLRRRQWSSPLQGKYTVKLSNGYLVHRIFYDCKV